MLQGIFPVVPLSSGAYGVVFGLFVFKLTLNLDEVGGQLVYLKSILRDYHNRKARDSVFYGKRKPVLFFSPSSALTTFI